MQTDRPVNLNLFTINLPFVALMSFTHRVTGGALFVGIGFGLYILQMALASPSGFAEAQAVMQTGFAKFIFLGLLFVLVFHVLAGIKHLLLDFHVGDSLEAAQGASIAVAILTVLCTAVLGALLW